MLSVLFALGCNDRTPPAAPEVHALNSGLGTLVSVKPVRVTQGFTVIRNGEELSVQDGLLIRLKDVSQHDFLPRAITPPMFVLGDTIGTMLIPPMGGREAVLLMDASRPGTRVPLWVTEPGASPATLKGDVLRSAQSVALSATASDGLDIDIPPESTPRATYRSLDDLRVYELKYKVSKETCAKMGKECGVVEGLNIGSVDCGPCPKKGQLCGRDNVCCPANLCQTLGRTCGPPSESCDDMSCGACATGDVCTGEGRCCRPRTCAGQGLSCGPLDDGCGKTLDCGVCPSSKH